MFNKLKDLFKKPEPPKVEVKESKPKAQRKPRKPKETKEEPKLSAKELATQNGEPYVAILKIDIDPENINAGAFELDFNDKFVLNLIRAGYKIREDDTDQVIVDRWFQTVARNIALELYEQETADPDNRYRNDMRTVYSKDLGDGRREVG
jgi:hypothetical protein